MRLVYIVIKNHMNKIVYRDESSIVGAWLNDKDTRKLLKRMEE